MFLRRLLLAVGALLCLSSALMGVELSGATWTNTSETTAEVSAAYDWTPPTVTVSDPGSSVRGSSVTIKAIASDSRSSIASATIEYAPAGTSTWRTLNTCSSSGTTTVTYTCTWDTTTGVPDGSYQLRATATDAAGNSATSPLVYTAVTNNVSVALTRLPAYVRGTVPVRGDLYNAVTPGTQLVLEYGQNGTWRQLNGSCSSTSTPIQCGWNTSTTAVPDGTYDVRVVASTGQSDTQTGIVVDNTAPATPTLTVPSGVLSGTVSLGTTVAPDSPAGIASVVIQYRLSPSGTWFDCGTGTASPYSCSLDTTKLSNVAYDFRAVATDSAGNATASDPVTRTVDNSPATVAFSSPSNGATVDGTVTVSGTGQSARGITALKVEYRQTPSGTFQTLCSPAPAATFSCSWNTTPLASGSYELRATLSQTSGGDVTSTITVNVSHSTGTVAITSPAAGSTVQNTVTVSGTASATGGVKQVQVKVANGSGSAVATLSCTVSSGSFSCPWNTMNLLYGTYQLRAEMTQNDNAVVTSNVVNVTVYNASITLGAVPVNLRGTSATLSATASSNAGITRVRFEGITSSGTTATLCTATVTTDGTTATTYSCSWDISAITYGVYTVRAVMVQGSSLPEVQSVTATTTVDNRTLAGYDVWTVNGGTANKPDAGDQIFFQYTGLVNLNSVRAGLTYGGSASVDVSLKGDPGSAPDTMTFTNANLGGLTLSQKFPKNNTTVTFAGSTMTAVLAKDAQGNDVTVIRVTLGTPSVTDLAVVTGTNTITWTPSALATAPFGNACLATVVAELGAADPDF